MCVYCSSVEQRYGIAHLIRGMVGNLITKASAWAGNPEFASADILAASLLTALQDSVVESEVTRGSTSREVVGIVASLLDQFIALVTTFHASTEGGRFRADLNGMTLHSWAQTLHVKNGGRNSWGIH